MKRRRFFGLASGGLLVAAATPLRRLWQTLFPKPQLTALVDFDLDELVRDIEKRLMVAQVKARLEALMPEYLSYVAEVEVAEPVPGSRMLPDVKFTAQLAGYLEGPIKITGRIST